MKKPNIYVVDGKTFTNGREACQHAWDKGYLPNRARPELTDKFNPLMLLQTAAAQGCELFVNGKRFAVGASAEQPQPVPNPVPQPQPEPQQTKTQNQKTNTDVSTTTQKSTQQLADALQNLLNSQAPKLDENRVIELIKQHSVDENLLIELIQSHSSVKTIEIKKPDVPKVNIGVQHRNFETLLKMASTGVNIMLVGEAGSGKSSAAKKIAEALNLTFHFISCGLTTTKYEFSGFIDASGRFASTEFFTAFTEGGLFLLDEFDAASPNVGIALNEALANRRASFADGCYEAHPDFICIAAANTYGNGATMDFVGRQKLDAATLDRFVVLDWDIDEDFENAITPNKAWTKKVQQYRAAVKKLAIRHSVTPRASIDGAKLLSVGVPESQVIDSVILKGLSTDARKQIQAAL